MHTIVTRPVVNLKLLADGNTAKHNDLQDITEYRGLKGISRQTHLEALNEVDRDRLAGVPSQVAHGYIGVELGQTRVRRLRARAADVLLAQEELQGCTRSAIASLRAYAPLTHLRAQILHGHWLRVEDGDGLDTGENDVLG